jgi:hypothetical protein
MDPGTIVDTHMAELDDRSRPTVERLIEVILGALGDAQHEHKWNRLTFTRRGDWHHWICAISPSTEGVKLVIHKGAMLADPHAVMEGTGRYTRTIAIGGPDAIDPRVLVPILQQAADRQTEMLPATGG